MAGEKKADNTLYENGIGWTIMLCIFAILAAVFWYYHATDVRNGIRWIRYYEMWAISWFISDEFKVIYNGAEAPWRRGFEDTPNFRADLLTIDHLSYFIALTMQPLKWIMIALLSAAGLWCVLYGPGTQFRTCYGLEGFIRRQAKNFPVIAPFVNFNPSKQPPRAPGTPVPAELPPFAEALGPEEWIAYNSIPMPEGKIDDEAALAAFTTQLGERWKGPNALPGYQQVLLASFCLKAMRKRKECDALLGRLARCWNDGALKLGKDKKLLADARKILRDKDMAGKTLTQANRHAFVTTALLRALMFARSEGGVLASAQFVWLRAYDRTLWYPLNNMGRQSLHMEAMGAMAHFKAEKMTQRPIPVPKVGDAVQTIKEYMGSARARPVPPLDYSRSAKRGVKAAR